MPDIDNKQIRSILNNTLRLDTELDAFCMDYFSEVYSNFSVGMDRTAKLSMLMTMVHDNEKILQHLKEKYPARLQTQADFVKQTTAQVNPQSDRPNQPPSTPPPPQPSDTLSARQYVVLGMVLLTVGAGLLGIFAWSAQSLNDRGIQDRVYYIILLVLGVFMAVMTFAIMRSYAHYEGRQMSGTLVLSGPFLAAMIVVLVGLLLVPRDDTFDMTARLSCAGQPITQGRLRVNIDVDPREEDVNSKGEVNFKNIPRRFLGKSAEFFAKVPGCKAASDRPSLLLERLVKLELQGNPMLERELLTVIFPNCTDMQFHDQRVIPITVSDSPARVQRVLDAITPIMTRPDQPAAGFRALDLVSGTWLDPNHDIDTLSEYPRLNKRVMILVSQQARSGCGDDAGSQDLYRTAARATIGAQR